MNKFISIVLTSLCLILAHGCASGPIAPTDILTESQSINSDPVQLSHRSFDYYQLLINTELSAIDIIPIRSSSWHFNVTGILNTTMGVSAVIVPGETDPVCGIYTFDITLTHPFETKTNLTGFDVKGILMTPGTMDVDGDIFAGSEETHLLNPDGYSRWWNPTEFTSPGLLGYTEGALANTSSLQLTATVNAYKYFADILGPNDSIAWVAGEPLDSPLGRGVFTAGSSNTRRYSIWFPSNPDPEFTYGYAVDVAWNAPVPNPPSEIPDDFPVNANQPEAFRLIVQPSVNTLYYDTEAGVGGGVLRLLINVHDWQGQVAGDFQSEIDKVWIFAPELMSSGYTAMFSNETPIKGQYTIDLTNVTSPQKAGATYIFCKVVTSDGLTYQQFTEPAPNEPIASYQVIQLVIPNPSCNSDNNNLFSEAIPLELVDSAIDQLCFPIDREDFYSFQFDPGYHPYGEINLYCNAPPTTLSLLDADRNLIAESGLSNAVATITLDDLILMPDINYIRIQTSNTSQVVPYYLEINLEQQNVEPSNPVDLTPQELFAKGSRIFRTHTHAILTGSYGVWVYDMTDPVNPILDSYNPWYVSNDAYLFGNRLYFITNEIFNIGNVDYIDFSDPSNPILYDNVIHESYTFDGITMDGSYLYVGTPAEPGNSVNIYQYSSNPQAPELIHSFDFVGGVLDLAVMNPGTLNTKLIVATNDLKILAFDIDTIVNPMPNGVYNRQPGSFGRMITRQYRVYFTLYNTALDEGYLVALEHSTVIPDDLAEVDSITLPGFDGADGLYSWNPYAFIGDGDAGLTIISIDDPSNLQFESATPLISEGTDVIAYGDYVHVIPRDAGLQTFDASNGASPIEISRLQVVNGPRQAFIRGDHMLVAERAGTQYAIKIVDISNPANAHLVNLRQMDDAPVYMDIGGNIMAVLALDYCQLWDVTEPWSPQYYSTIYLGDYGTAACVNGKTLYVATNSSGMLIYDIAPPDSPTYLTTYGLSKPVTDFTLGENNMYLSNESGIFVYSLDDAQAPLYEGLYADSGEVLETEIQGPSLYIVTPENFEIAGLANPSSPVRTGYVPVAGETDLSEITVDGQYAYVQGGGSPVYACTLWPPDNPTVYGEVYDQSSLSMGGSWSDLLVHDGNLYRMNQYTGIRIHDLY